ncbi:MAG: AIR synthase-related protein, partial [Pseudopelagicola sp.]|nr:AIR synthase-related protein [Pseudopelagicola sp.]
GADIDLSAWELPAVFKWLAGTGDMAESELLKTFNCGIGMILVVEAGQAGALAERLSTAGETVAQIGTVSRGEGVRYSGNLL